MLPLPLLGLAGFQAILSKRVIAKPYACGTFDKPTSNSIDWKLALGGVLFGAGWGVSGMCPGPAVVAAVATPLPPILAYVGAMMAGFWLQGLFINKSKPAPTKPATS